MPHELTAEEREQKRQATEAKTAARRRLAAKDRLRALGGIRAGNLAQKERIDRDVLAELPRGLAEGVTYDEMAALTGLSRSRVAQVLDKWRKDNGVTTGGEPAPEPTPPKAKAEPAAKKNGKTPAPAKKKAPVEKAAPAKKTAGVVAAVGDL